MHYFLYIFFISGDRTKHLKNLHGIYKPGDSLAPVIGEAMSPGPAIHSSLPTADIPSLGQPTQPKLVPGNSAGKEPKVLSTTTSSLASTFTATSAAGPFFTAANATVVKPLQQAKFDPLDVNMSCTPSQETVSMSLDEVLQYAQPVADFF